MLLRLIGKNTLSKLNLPQVADGDYWLTKNGSNEKLVNIQGNGSNWEIFSTAYVKIVKNELIKYNKNDITVDRVSDMFEDKITLEEYKTYFISIGNLQNIYVMFCMPSYENSIRRLIINDGVDSVTIGNSRFI